METGQHIPAEERYRTLLELAGATFSPQSTEMIRQALVLADEKLAGRVRYDGSPLLGH